MLRPATPLALTFLLATVLLLLSCLTTPVVRSLSLAEYDGTRFGVWGYCSGTTCSSIEVGYSIAELDATRDQFSIDEATRHNVSYILIVHPIACLFSFLCFAMALAAHWHSPGHSARFLMASFLMTIPALLAALLAFLIDILLFTPHLSAGTWIVLASVILLLLGSIVSCGMRRTLISRKARRKRIAENAEMSGENYYARQNQKMAISRIDSPPTLSGASGSPFKEEAPVFGSYESANTTIVGAPSSHGQPESAVRGLNHDTSRNQPYTMPPNVGTTRKDQNPHTEPIQNDYYNHDGVAKQEHNRHNRPPQYRNRGGLISPTYAYSQQTAGNIATPPQYGYASASSREPLSNTYNNGNGGRGGGSSSIPTVAPHINSGLPGEINPYQANITDLAQSDPSPPGYRNNGYQSAGQRQPGLYSDRAIPLSSMNEDPQRESSFMITTASAQNPISDVPSRASTPKSVGYMEDVDPRFAEPVLPITSQQGQVATIARLQPRNRPFRSKSNPSSPQYYGQSEIPPMPDSLRSPAYPTERAHTMDRSRPPPQRDLFPRNSSALRPPQQVGYESRQNQSLDSLSLQEGQRSPATSDGSHFTSISQRGINPNWRPSFASNSPLSRPHNMRRRRPSREQVVLDSNPNFMLSFDQGIAGSRRGRGPRMRGNGRGGIRRTSSFPRGASSLASDSFGFSGMVRDGRYPVPP